MSPLPQDEGVSLDHLPLAFEGEVTLSPALDHLGKEDGAGRTHTDYFGCAPPKTRCLCKSKLLLPFGELGKSGSHYQKKIRY